MKMLLPSKSKTLILTGSIATLLASQSAQAATGIWTSTTDGNWSDTTKWNAGTVADGASFGAQFSTVGTAGVTVTTTLDSARTIRNVAKNATTVGNWFVANAGFALTLNSNNATLSSNIFNSHNGATTVTVDTNLVLTSNLVLTGDGNNGAQVIVGATAGGRNITGAGNITFNNSNTFGAGAMTVNSNINTTGGIFNTASAGSFLSAINGIIGNTVTGVTQNGSRTLTLAGQNLYSGGTTLSAGTLVAQDGLTATPGSNNFIKALGTGAVNVSGGTLNLRANGSGNAQTIITGDGTTGNNVMMTGVATAIISVDRFNGANTGSTIQLNNLTIGAQGLQVNVANGYGLQFVGTTTLTGNALFNTNTAASLLTLTGAVGDGGSGFGLTKAGLGNLILNGASSYTGVTVHTGGTLSINTLLNVSGGNSSLGAPVTALNGTIATGSTTFTGTLIFTGAGGNGTTGTNGYTDRVINLAGTTGGATLDQSGTGQLKFVSDFTATGVGSKTLTLQGSTAGTGEIAGAIVDNLTGTNLTSVVKSGSGTWTLSGINTYTGTTSVSVGTLLINGNSIAANGNVTVAASATLGGTGTIGGSVTSAGIIAPGNGGIGTLTIGGPSTLTGTLAVEASGATGDKLVAANNLDVTAATLTVTGTLTTPVVVAQCTSGALTGPFLTVSAPAGYTVAYTSTTATLTPPPTANFSSWRTTNGAGIQTLAQDHDNDGVANGIEYFLGGPSGNTTGYTPLPAVQTGPLRVTYIKGPGYTGAYTTDYYVETSTTLVGPWTPAAPNASPNVAGTVYLLSGSNVTYTFPTGTRQFARLVVTGP